MPQELPIPSDFRAFWTRTLDELDGVDPDLRRSARSELGSASVEVEQVEFRGLGGVRIGAWLARPRAPGSFQRLLVTGHGYTSCTSPAVDWAGRGWTVLSVDARGHGLSRRDLAPSFPGYATTGLEDRDSYILRGAYTDFYRAADMARILAGSRDAPVALWGESFSGGLAIAVAGLRRDLAGVVAAVPSFGDFPARRTLVKGGSGAEVNQFIGEITGREPRVMEVLSCFDVAHLASRATAPLLAGLGREDDIVPAQTVRTIYHRYAGRPKRLLEYPRSHSGQPGEEQEWSPFRSEAEQFLEDCWTGAALQVAASTNQ